MAAKSVRWSCARCEVSVGMLDGAPTPFPATWTRSGDSTFCLTCSRALAGEAAIDSAPPTCSREQLFLLRREAVIRFEIDRMPLAPNRTIALACRTSTMKVASVRNATPSPGGERPADLVASRPPSRLSASSVPG